MKHIHHYNKYTIELTAVTKNVINYKVSKSGSTKWIGQLTVKGQDRFKQAQELIIEKL